MHREGALVGFAVFNLLEAVGVAFLEYMAVEEHLRGQGIGAGLLRALRASLRDTAAAVQGVLLEVDPPDGAEGDERRLRERRISFYLRNEAVMIDGFRLMAPNLLTAGSVELLLMWVPLHDGATRLEGDRLRECVRQLLVDGYELDASDPFIELNLRNLEGASRYT